MSHSPFSASPDVFMLALPRNTGLISVRAYESAWGTTDELLCYVGEILIGQLASRAEHTAGTNADESHIRLLPKLDKERDYPWPEPDSFFHALIGLLQAADAWYIRCEYDCDQYPLQEVRSHPEALASSIRAAIQYSLNQSSTCPSFIASRSVTNNSFKADPLRRRP